MRALALAAACGTAACFGSGPNPTEPADATVVFTTPADPSDCIGYYIAGVAFGSGVAYVETPEYGKPSSNNNGNCDSSGDPNTAVPLWSVPTTGGSAQMIASIGPDPSSGPPRIAAGGSNAAWAVASGTGGSAISVGAPMVQNVAIEDPGAVNGNSMPVAYLIDDAGAYVASWQGYTNESPASPTYPGTGGAQAALNYLVDISGGTPGAQLYGGGAITFNFACATAYDCMAMDPVNLFWFDAMTMSVRVARRDGTSTGSDAGSNAGPFGGQAPVGIAAGGSGSDRAVAWTLSTDYNSEPLSQQGCTVFANGKMLFASTTFQCAGAATDGTYVYFAIVQARDDGGGSPRVDGIGLGRVAIATGALEAIALGESADDLIATGPRRVYYEPATKKLWAVDPRVIATFDPDVLAGHHDFQ